MSNNLAPIVLFTYNRLNHTKQTIEALQKNELAKKSHLILYSDGGKDSHSWTEVAEVRQYLKTISGFKSIEIIEQIKNIGLANSIISGVTQIINKYNKVIVLEDDILVSKYFLNYMNDALTFYGKNDEIWHISAYTQPIAFIAKEDVYIWRRMDCWGWATWKDKWDFFEKDSSKLIDEFTQDDIYKFNLDNTHTSWNQVILNNTNKINTWGIFWYTTIYKNKGLCVSPKISYVKNIGLDGSGVHCNIDTSDSTAKLNCKKNILFCENIKEDIEALELNKEFYRKKNRIKDNG